MGDSEKLRMSAELAEKIRQHGVETYPHECCGALLGRDDPRFEDLVSRIGLPR